MDKSNIIKMSKQENSNLFVVENVDKMDWVEKWSPGRDILNFPKSYRAIIIGPCSVGKGIITKNIVCKADPPFDVIKIFHCASSTTNEWDDILYIDEEHKKKNENAEFVDSVPDLDSWDASKKNLFIIDDVDLKSLSKEQGKLMNRTLGYVSSHKNVCCIAMAQDLLQSSASMRRMMNIYVLFKIADMDGMAVLARKIGLKRKYFIKICSMFKTVHDHILVDNTPGSPAPLRWYDTINKCYHKIELPEDED